MTWSQEVEQKDAGNDQETSTMEAFIEIFSSILRCLNFTWNFPSRNTSGMRPVLETQMWIGVPTRSWDLPEILLDADVQIPTKTGTLQHLVMYKFFGQLMACKTPMNSGTAAPAKIQTAKNEFLGDMKNPSKELECHHLEEIIQEYSIDLQRGGYTPVSRQPRQDTEG